MSCLKAFLYETLKNFPAGKVEKLVQDSEKTLGKRVQYCNPHLEAYAEELAGRLMSDKKPPVTDVADDSSENEELLKSEILGLREQLTVLKEDNKRSSDNERRKLSAAKSELRKALTQNEDLSKKLGEAARQIMELQAQIDTGNSVVAPE